MRRAHVLKHFDKWSRPGDLSKLSRFVSNDEYYPEKERRHALKVLLGRTFDHAKVEKTEYGQGDFIRAFEEISAHCHQSGHSDLVREVLLAKVADGGSS